MDAVTSTLREGWFGLRSLAALISTSSSNFNEAVARVFSPQQPGPLVANVYWQQNPILPDLVDTKSPKLPHSADVVIIGSGMAGASVAYTLLREYQAMGVRKRVIILEARQICSGATGRNGGHIKASPYHAYSQYKARFGAAHAKKLCDFQLMHLPTLLSIAEHEGLVDAEVRSVQTLDVFTDTTMWQKAQIMVEELRADVPAMAEDICIYKSTNAQETFGLGEHCVGAISYTAGAMWPYRFVTSLYDRMLADHGELFSIETGTLVEDMEVNKDASHYPYVLKTQHGSITASHVVHATDGFAANLVPGLRGKVFPVRGHMTAQKPGTSFPNYNGSQSWSFIHRDGYDYVTQRPGRGDAVDGKGAEILIGGGMTHSPAHGIDEFGIWRDNKTSFSISSYLSGALGLMFNSKTWGHDRGEARIKALWSGCMGFTTDLLPFVGRLDPNLTRRKQSSPDTLHNEWIVAGFGGEGMVHAWLSGVALGITIVGREDINCKGEYWRPPGRVQDWFPDQLYCSKGRVVASSLTEMATML